MHKIIAERNISTTYIKLYDLIWDIKKWSTFWSPLKEVEVLYDDGCHQEFNIFVSWEGKVVPVRTVRYREGNGDITFFSPVPPPPTTKHYGAWMFSPTHDGRITLSAVRHFSYDFDDRDVFAARFQKRLDTLLIKIEELCQI